jgi:hypothetical protein
MTLYGSIRIFYAVPLDLGIPEWPPCAVHNCFSVTKSLQKKLTTSELLCSCSVFWIWEPTFKMIKVKPLVSLVILYVLLYFVSSFTGFVNSKKPVFCSQIILTADLVHDWFSILCNNYGYYHLLLSRSILFFPSGLCKICKYWCSYSPTNLL